MKKKYLIAIIILIAAAVLFEALVLCSSLGEHSRLEKAIQGLSVFVALIAVVTALSAGDRKERKVQIEVGLSAEKREEAPKSRIKRELRPDFEEFADPVESCRVQFKIINVSGFTLEKPTLTFRLPGEKRHPAKPLATNGTEVDSGPHTRRTFHSNLYYSRDELRMLEFGDAVILSNSNLPYWNDQDDITIWIRMALNDTSWKPFSVKVSVNCGNAIGYTRPVKISPKEMLDMAREKTPRSEVDDQNL